MEYRFHAGQQGLDRAIPFLKDQLDYLESYQFESDQLEAVRQSRLATTKLRLGLYLIQIGQTQKGRKLVLEGSSASFLKAGLALALASFNSELRHQAFRFLQVLNNYQCYLQRNRSLYHLNRKKGD